jgi:signal transduction histidine kinase
MIAPKWWNDISVSKKLYGLVGVMALLIGFELFILHFAMTTLSAVRSYVNGEALWSKAQKNAVNNLERYARGGNELYYRRFLENVKVPLGDHRARLGLEKSDLDLDSAREGFLAGGNHPEDILPMVNFYKRFHSMAHFARALEAWREADAKLFELVRLGAELHQRMTINPSRSKTESSTLLEQISDLNLQLTDLENEFSMRLGEASRWVERILIVLLLCAVFTIEGAGIFLTSSLGRNLSSGLNELLSATVKVGRGDFNHIVPIRSNDELGKLAAGLNVMTASLRQQVNERAQAQQASQAKTLFLANMSHEIRTPLNAILGFSELLQDPDISNEEKRQYFDIVKRTGANLTTLISDILDISKIESEQLDIEKSVFSIAQLLTDLKMVLRLRFGEKGIQLNVTQRGTVAEFILSDSLRLRQILVNMIGNAIKFTERGSVHVVYEVLEGQLVFTVKDTGVGISAEQVHLLFKPFSQGDHSARKRYGGTGLGLIISQRLAQLLGGSVELKQSSVDIGSTFEIRIDYQPVDKAEALLALAHADAPAQSPTDPNILRGKKILVVEDMLENQILVKLFLSKSGAHVEFANDGESGLKLAMEKSFDLIFMDVQMPIMDGYTATANLRLLGCRTPIIALTGYAMQEDRMKSLAVGCDDYMSKPVDRIKLINLAAKHIGRQPLEPAI